MIDDEFRAPTDDELDAAEKRLGLAFHPDYRSFQQGRRDLGDSILEPALILPCQPHLDLFEIAESAWKQIGLPRDLLPIVEDNGDYYCVTSSGEVAFWSHDSGRTEESWPTIEAWRQATIDEAGE